MSQEAPRGAAPAEAPRTRGPRNAVVAVALLALVLVVVLTRLVGGGPEGTGPGSAEPGTSASPAPSSSATSSRSATTRAPSAAATRDPETGLRLVALSSLPREAQQTVALVERGGPFPYRQDGATFGNRERRLPSHPSGWYREYTVVTPGEDDRGPRRIVTGDDDRQVFYTGDHYGSFVRVAR
ncbi:ribonuclease T1 [Microlunatus sagamiharensis]|uniref:Ribonuclease T1 n=1 Tax=Microlunatus sagamiharensis TaxID=546874 RepID=A0A1H2MQW0_9ACTN|nr:ribonuclease domain-containing protein [Microlunatus sagamiharensis]SDU95378.1 ribonuclease T1 [Microlunatus sagamiharensis]